MEHEVQEATQVPRSELESALEIGRSFGWMVVQSMPTTPWGYVLHPLRGAGADEHLRRYFTDGLPITLGLLENR